MRISDWSSDVCSSDLCYRNGDLLAIDRESLVIDDRLEAAVELLVIDGRRQQAVLVRIPFDRGVGVPRHQRLEARAAVGADIVDRLFDRGEAAVVAVAEREGEIGRAHV